MDSERPHRNPSTSSSATSELFVCFTSRLSSSSSMKISKSILSPGRSREPPAVSLSTSLSRRLRTNGSLKRGQASPMFPTGAKKRGCAFENPEPSSPKVTCIGQVRVKTKKKSKQTRSLSRRRSNGEASFRKLERAIEGGSQNQGLVHDQVYQQTNPSSQFQQQECLPHRNQRWVHFPLTICEALRAFGAEFRCLFPCRSSCFSSAKEEKAAGSTGGGTAGQSSCGAAFARWLVALQDGEAAKGREIELVMGGEEERGTEVTERSIMNSRRHVLEDMDKFEAKDEAGEEEEARVSICIPPKNALLLMRCRSDPMKVAALANRFWESPAHDEEDEEDEDEDEQKEGKMFDEKQDGDEEEQEEKCVQNVANKTEQTWDGEPDKPLSSEANEEPKEKSEWETNLDMDEQAIAGNVPEEKLKTEVQEEKGEIQYPEETNKANQTPAIPVETDLRGSALSEDVSNQENTEPEQEEDPCRSFPSPAVQLDGEEEGGEPEDKALTEDEDALGEEDEVEEKSTAEKETQEISLEDEQQKTATTRDSSDTEEELETAAEEEEDEVRESEKAENEEEEEEIRSSRSVLPECLLLMMCEPKVSMEVSKETWVCSTDFIRWQLPEKQVNQTDGRDKSTKRVSANSKAVPAAAAAAMTMKPKRRHSNNQLLHQPPRSSCTLPAAAAASMATMIEQKLVSAGAYEPFVLTRCKSEPMRTAASKLLPEACFWKNGTIEPHRGTTLGVGAAGVGF